MGEDEKTKVLWWIAGAVLGSVGLNQGINKSFPAVRSDPYTGSQGKMLHNDVLDVTRRVNDIDKEQWRMISRMIRVEAVSDKCTEMIQEHLRNPHQ